MSPARVPQPQYSCAPAAVMERRTFLAMVSGSLLAAPLAAEAQQVAKTYRIGFIGLHSPGLESEVLWPFQTRLRELGWVDGGNLAISYRWADSAPENYLAIVPELVKSDVDVIVTPCGRALSLLRKLSSTVPVVVVCMDLKGFGHEIETLDRPGRYTTGVTYFSVGGTARRLAVLKEALPGLAHVALLYRPDSDWMEHWAAIEAAARGVNVRLRRAEWVHQFELAAVFDDAIRHRVGALLTLGDRWTIYYRHSIFALAAERRLPVLYDFPMSPAAEEVGLMSYYADIDALYRRVAGQVDQILKGKKPGDIPVEIPETFRLVINQRAARRLGLTLSSSLLLRADQVIE